MRQTRAALAEKLETLVYQVIGAAKEAVCSVQKTVETVTRTVNDTVTGAKETVQCTVSAAKDTMHETVDALKHAFDLKEHVVEHPWTMMAASTAAGFLAGRLLTAAKPDGATRQGSFHEPMSTQPGPDKEGGLRSKFA